MPVATPPLTATQIFLRAQATWSERAQPRYEAFSVPCSVTYLASRCSPAVRIRFIVRLTDGRTYAETIASDAQPASVLLRGGYITGPAGAPLGFYRRAPDNSLPFTPPPNLAADPLRTIATVTAVDYAYRVRLIGDETLGGVTTAHLTLAPLRKPDVYLLRDLWVAVDSDEVVRLVYEEPFGKSSARITYDFAPVGETAIWTIVHISAATSREAVSESLDDIEFPPSEPDSYFTH